MYQLLQRNIISKCFVLEVVVVVSAVFIYLFIYLFITSKAGLSSSNNPEQIMIALEPEAAALSCLEKNMSDFQSETGSTSLDGLLSQPNSHYMVVDIGGKFILLIIKVYHQ